MKMNQKIKDAHNEVISMSDKSVQELIDAVRSKIHPLFKISESLALLDMLSGMAQTVTTQDYVKPDLTDSTLALKSSRHPILDKLFPSHSTTTKLIPNDVYSTPQHRFQIITGANMSGKSTYIRSIALNTVLAQTGCFVPAQYASFPIFHQLFALLATDSNVEANVSSFASEMSSVAFILRNIEPRSLLIVDELGRGTSTTDGLAIAIAIAEALIESKAFVWFVTHFHDLPRILAERAGVVNLHLNVDITPSSRDPRLRARGVNASNSHTDTSSTNATADPVLPTKMKMTYRIAPGPLPSSSQYYGLTLARTISLPTDVIDVATQVSKALHERNEARKSNPQAMAVARRRKLMLGLREQLRQAKESAAGRKDDGIVDEGALQEWLGRLQDEFIVRLGVIEGEAEAVALGDETEEDADMIGLHGQSQGPEEEGFVAVVDTRADAEATPEPAHRTNPEHTRSEGQSLIALGEQAIAIKLEHKDTLPSLQSRQHTDLAYRPSTSATGSTSILEGGPDDWTTARAQNESQYRQEMETRRVARRYINDRN